MNETTENTNGADQTLTKDAAAALCGMPSPVVWLNDEQWAQFMDAMNNPAEPTEALKRGAKMLMELRAQRTSKEQAMREAAAEVMNGIAAGRQAFRDGRPRTGMANDSQRIGWDEAQYDVDAKD